MACFGQPPALGPELVRRRTAIERDFAHEVTIPCGIKHLPFWVRTPHRTATWVQCKLIIILAWTHRKDLC